MAGRRTPKDLADRMAYRHGQAKADDGFAREMLRVVIGATTIDAKLLIAAERLQYEGYLSREETNAVILALSKNGISIKQITWMSSGKVVDQPDKTATAVLLDIGALSCCGSRRRNRNALGTNVQ